MNFLNSKSGQSWLYELVTFAELNSYLQNRSRKFQLWVWKHKFHKSQRLAIGRLSFLYFHSDSIVNKGISIWNQKSETATKVQKKHFQGVTNDYPMLEKWTKNENLDFHEKKVSESLFWFFLEAVDAATRDIRFSSLCRNTEKARGAPSPSKIVSWNAHVHTWLDT